MDKQNSKSKGIDFGSPFYICSQCGNVSLFEVNVNSLTTFHQTENRVDKPCPVNVNNIDHDAPVRCLRCGNIFPCYRDTASTVSLILNRGTKPIVGRFIDKYIEPLVGWYTTYYIHKNPLRTTNVTNRYTISKHCQNDFVGTLLLNQQLKIAEYELHPIWYLANSVGIEFWVEDRDALIKGQLCSDLHFSPEPYIYDVRHHDDDESIPCTLEAVALVNHWGTILCDDPDLLKEREYLIIRDYRKQR